MKQKLFYPLKKIKDRILVNDIMTDKIISLNSDNTVYKAIEVMGKKSISTIVILEKKNPVGIVTERDLVKKLLLKKKDPEKTKLKDIMTKDPKTISKGASVLKASNIMQEKKVRHLVVVEDGKAIGVVSQTDIINSMNEIYKNYTSLFLDSRLLLYLAVLIILLYLLNIFIFKI